jgi:hypothetical protein
MAVEKTASFEVSKNDWDFKWHPRANPEFRGQVRRTKQKII